MKDFMKNIFSKSNSPREFEENKETEEKLREEEAYYSKKETPPTNQMRELTEEELSKIKQSENILKLTLDLINKGNEALSQQAADEAILLIGRTGVGKSTLVNYLANPENMHAVHYKDAKIKHGKGKLVLDIKDKDDSLAKIGHKMDSETTIPNRWGSNDVLYWDCPGFDHTDNPEIAISQDIANAFFIKKIFDITSNVKVLLVLSWDELSSKANQIKAITDQLGNLFQGKDFEKILEGLSLIVTKTTSEQDVDDIKGKLEEVINSACFSGESAGRDIIEFLLDSEDRISTFNTPKQEGSIFEGKNEKLLGLEKHGEITQIIKQAKFVEKPQVNIAVADKSLLAVEEIAKSINEQVLDTLFSICENIKESYDSRASYTIKSAHSVDAATNLDTITNLMKFLSALDTSVDKLVKKSSEARSAQTLVKEIEQKLINNDGIDNINVDKNTFQELSKNVEYIEFFKQINKKAEGNIRVDEWIGRFKDFNKTLVQEIDKIKGELQNKFYDKEEKNIELFIDQLKLCANELSDRCFKSKNYTMYKEYVQRFKWIGNFIKKAKTVDVKTVTEQLEKMIIEPFDLDSQKLNEVRLSDSFNRAIDFKETAATYEKELNHKLNLFSSDISHSYEKSIKEFMNTTTYEVRYAIEILLEKIRNHNKTIKSIEELENVENILTNIAKEAKESGDLLVLMSGIEALFVECKIDRDLIERTNKSIKVLHNIISMEDEDDDFKEEEIKLIGEYTEEICKICEHDIPSLTSTLVDNILVAAERNINDSISKFINKVTLYASQNKDKVGILAETFDKHREQVKDETDIVKIIDDIKLLLESNMEDISLQPLNQILDEIKKIEHLKGVDKILDKIDWVTKIEDLAKGIKDSDNALVRQALDKNIKYLFDEIENVIHDKVPDLEDVDTMYTTIKNISSLFPTDQDLSFKIDNVRKLVGVLLKIIDESGIEISAIHKDNLLEIKDKTTDIDNDIKLRIANFSKYLKDESHWYGSLEEKIYKKLSSPDLIFNNVKKDCYRTLDHDKFGELLKECDVYDIPYDKYRCEQLQKLINVTLSDNSSIDYSNGKWIISGNFIKMSDVVNKAGANYFIEAIATDTVYFDLTSMSSTVGMAIIAPKWYMPKAININLNGTNGVSYYNKASDGGGYGSSGSNGAIGGNGTSAGHFYGIIGNIGGSDTSDINNLKMLKVTANGGNGGKGQDGGNGYKGADGSDAGSVTRENYTSISISGTLSSDGTPAVSAYLLKGSNGGVGGNGGNAGCGGRGGYAGKVKLYKNGNDNIGKDIAASVNAGQNGADGVVGRGGAGGRNGDSTRDQYVLKPFHGSTDGLCTHSHTEGWWRCDGKWPKEKLNYETNGYASSGYGGSINRNYTNPNNTESDFKAKVASTKADFNKIIISKEQNSEDFGVKMQLPALRKFYNDVQLSGDGLNEHTDANFGYDKFFNKYYASGLDEILKLRLKMLDANKVNADQVQALKAKFVFDETTTSAKQIIDEALQLILQNADTKVLVPYNILHKHWVGMAFELKDNAISVTYFDPENNPAPNSLVDDLKAMIGELGINVVFKEMIVPDQTANNCGSEVVEDFVLYLTDNRIEQGKVLQYHSMIVEEALLGESTLDSMVHNY